MNWSYAIQKDWKAHTNVEVLLEYIAIATNTMAGNTADIEALLTQANVFLQNIDLNTDTLEALIGDSNTKLDDILAELQTQTGIMNTQTTALTTINTSINNAAAATDLDLNAIQVQLGNILTELQAVNTNTAPLEAAINAFAADVDVDLDAIQIQLGQQITLLTGIDSVLDSIYAQFTGTVAINEADISGNAAYGTVAATYNSIQLTVYSGTVSRGAMVYQVGVWPITAPLNKTLPAFTFNATGASAYIELMS